MVKLSIGSVILVHFTSFAHPAKLSTSNGSLFVNDGGCVKETAAQG
jgi:hypothetical protein